MTTYIIPAIFLLTIAYAHFKKVDVYSSFVSGTKNGLTLGFEIAPFVITILLAIALFRESGLLALFTQLTNPIFGLFGVPGEVCELVILKPFSGSGSLAILGDILQRYGVDSYIGRCACAIMGSSETIFYVSCVYTSKCKTKNLGYAIPIALVASFFGCIISCAVCKVL